MIEVFFRLLFAHALADFALQPELMYKGKSRHRDKDLDCFPVWYVVLSAHALICGGMVYWATGSLLLGIVEIGLHWMIDYAKCENVINPNQDQVLHLICRLFYL